MLYFCIFGLHGEAFAALRCSSRQSNYKPQSTFWYFALPLSTAVCVCFSYQQYHLLDHPRYLNAMNPFFRAPLRCKLRSSDAKGSLSSIAFAIKYLTYGQ